jgi:hypothetical protein
VFLDTRVLSAAGTYTVVVDPQGAATGQVTVAVFDVPDDVVLETTPGGDPVTVGTTVPGQNGVVQFPGTVGQRVSVQLSAGTFGSSAARVSVLNPNGSTLVSATTFSNNGVFLDTRVLSAAGTYTVVVDPQGAATGQVTVAVFDVPADNVTHITTDGQLFLLEGDVPGQNMTATFDGQSGQRISLKVDSVVSGTLTITAPDGTPLLPTQNLGSTVTLLNVNLPDDGTYSIKADPTGPLAQIAIRLWHVPTTAAATAVVGGPEESVATTAPGQDAEIQFAGVEDQRLSIHLSDLDVNQINLVLLRPDGSQFATFNSVRAGAVISVPALAETGVHTLRLVYGNNYGSASLSITDVPVESVAPLEVGTGPVDVAINAIGQRAVLRFDAAAGENLRIAFHHGPRFTVHVPASGGATTARTLFRGGVHSFAAQNTGINEIWVDSAGEVGIASIEIYAINGAPVINSTTTPRASWVSQAQVTATWQSNSTVAVGGYSVAFDQMPDTTPAPTISQTTTSFATTAADGQHWLHVRSVTSSGHWGPTAHYPIFVDATAPMVSTITSPTHPDPGVSHPALGYSLEWSGADATSGVAGYSVFVSTLEEDDWTPTVTTTTPAYDGELSREGAWYAHVKAVDHAGNWSTPVTITLNADTNPTAPIIVSSTHPQPGVDYSGRRFVASWGSIDHDQPVAWSVVIDSVDDTVPDPTPTTPVPRVATELLPGTWWLHVRAQDDAGHWGPPAHYKVVIANASARFLAPPNGETLWGLTAIAVTCNSAAPPDIQIAPHSDESPTTWSTLGPTTVQPDGSCGLSWDVSAIDDEQQVWPDGQYILRSVSPGGAIEAESLEVIIDADLPSSGRLAADFAAGTISLDDYSRYMVLLHLDPTSVPDRYTTGASKVGDEGETESLLGKYWTSLLPDTRQEITDMLTLTVEQEPSFISRLFSFGASSSCGFLIRLGNAISAYFDCVAETDHIKVVYNSSDVPTSSHGQDVADWAEDAWAVYEGLGFKMPEKVTYVLLPYDTGLALPFGITGIQQGPIIVMASTADPPGLPGYRTYLTRHELFHAVQYEYITNPVGKNWWMEATAEWAAHQVQAISPTHGSYPYYASNLREFIGRSDDSFDNSGGLGSVGNGRQYGAFILAEFLEERYGASVIEESWRRTSGWGTSPTDAIGEVIRSRSVATSDEIELFRQWTYVLARNQNVPGTGFADPDAGTTWRAHLQELPGSRPPHEGISLSGGQTYTESAKLNEGGAAYVEFTKPAGVSGTLNVVVTGDDLWIRASVLLDRGRPEPDLCDAPTRLVDHLPGDDTTRLEVSITLTEDCPKAILSITNTLWPGFLTPRKTAEWSASFTAGAALLSNGTVNLGVGRNGAVDPCVLELHGKVHLVGRPENANGGCPNDAWALADMTGRFGGVGEVTFHGSGDPVTWEFTKNLEPISFQTSATDATAVTQVNTGQPLLVTHRFHPSSDPHLFRVDVTVQNSGNATSGPLRYRRSFDFEPLDPLGSPTTGWNHITFAKTTPNASDWYVRHTIGCHGGTADFEKLFLPSRPRGYFTDLQGSFGNSVCPTWPAIGMIELDLGTLGPNQSLTFSLFVGAAPDEASALAAVNAVESQLYFFGQHASGATTGEPITFIVAVDGRLL